MTSVAEKVHWQRRYEAKNWEAGGLKTNGDRLQTRDELCCMVEYSCCPPIYSQELRLHICTWRSARNSAAVGMPSSHIGGVAGAVVGVIVVCPRRVTSQDTQCHRGKEPYAPICGLTVRPRRHRRRDRMRPYKPSHAGRGAIKRPYAAI